MAHSRGTRWISTHVGAGMLAITLAFAATGCSASSPEAAVSEASSPSPTTSADPASPPPAASTPTEPAQAPVAGDPSAALSCDTLLTPAGYSQLETDGMESREPTGGSTDISATIQAAGGILCTWGRPSTDIVASVGAAPLDEALWAAVRERLIEAGFSPDDSILSGFLTAPPLGQDHPGAGVVYSDGSIYYVSAPLLLDWIPALQS